MSELTDADLAAIEAQMADCLDQPYDDCPCHEHADRLLAEVRRLRATLQQPQPDLSFLAYPPGGGRCRVCGRHVDALGAVHPECARDTTP